MPSYSTSFNLIFSSFPYSHFPSSFPHKTLQPTHFPSSPHMPHALPISSSLTDHPNNIYCTVQIVKFHFLHPVSHPPSQPQIPPSTPHSQTPSVHAPP